MNAPRQRTVPSDFFLWELHQRDANKDVRFDFIRKRRNLVGLFRGQTPFLGKDFILLLQLDFSS